MHPLLLQATDLSVLARTARAAAARLESFHDNNLPELADRDTFENSVRSLWRLTAIHKTLINLQQKFPPQESGAGFPACDSAFPPAVPPCDPAFPSAFSSLLHSQLDPGGVGFQSRGSSAATPPVDSPFPRTPAGSDINTAPHPSPPAPAPDFTAIASLLNACEAAEDRLAACYDQNARPLRHYFGFHNSVSALWRLASVRKTIIVILEAHESATDSPNPDPQCAPQSPIVAPSETLARLNEAAILIDSFAPFLDPKSAIPNPKSEIRNPESKIPHSAIRIPHSSSPDSPREATVGEVPASRQFASYLDTAEQTIQIIERGPQKKSSPPANDETTDDDDDDFNFIYVHFNKTTGGSFTSKFPPPDP